MREDIREIIVEMFDTNAFLKKGGIDLAVAKIEALYKKKCETIDEDLKKVCEQKYGVNTTSIVCVDLKKDCVEAFSR